MKEYHRRERVGPQLQRELMELLGEEHFDPRVSGVTVTEVDVSTDLKSAKVYVSRLGRDTDEAVEALGELAGRLRGRLGKRLRLRYVPTLKFLSDAVPDRAADLNRLIAQARASDADKKQD